jgi:ketosteroid isomerase-like protein
MSRTPREVAELVRKMVAGEGISFADLFAADGVLAYPFAFPGQPPELRGRDAIRAYFAQMPGRRAAFVMEGIDAVIRETDDPEVVVAEISHHGRSTVTGAPYELKALGVIRVRDGDIVQYDDYMNPLALAAMLGRTKELAAALAEA